MKIKYTNSYKSYIKAFSNSILYIIIPIVVSSISIPLFFLILEFLGIIDLLKNYFHNKSFLYFLVLIIIILYSITISIIISKNEKYSSKKLKKMVNHHLVYFNIFIGFGIGNLTSIYSSNNDGYIIGTITIFSSLIIFLIYLLIISLKFKNKSKSKSKFIYIKFKNKFIEKIKS